MTEVCIRIDDKTYKNAPQPTIYQFDLTIHANEFVCLVGSSGCGKTTLLNCLAGLDTQFSGQILIEPKHASPKIGYVFQNPRLLPWRTVRENIELVMPYVNADVDALLAVMQLTNFQHEYP